MKKSWFARNRGYFLLTGAAIVLIVAVGVMFGLRRTLREPYTGPVWPVTKQKLQLTITERGALESAENSDVICRVKAKSQGTSVASSIKWVIDDGTPVEKGQLLVELDDSGLQDQLRTQINLVNAARASWISADENFVIVESQNFSDIENAKATKITAEIDLRKYLGQTATEKVSAMESHGELKSYLLTRFEADARKEQELALAAEKKAGSLSSAASAPKQWVSEFLQSINEIEGTVETTRSDLEQWIDRSEWSKRMAARGFVSRSQAESDLAKRNAGESNLKKVQGQLDILRKYTLERTATDLWSKVQEGNRALKRVTTQAKSKENTAESDRQSKKEIFDQEIEKRKEIEEQIGKCVIYSPQDGLVVYYISEQSRFGSGSQQSTVAQGEPVREGQKLMRIPNLNKMLVNARIHEAMVSKIKGEVYKPTGFGDALRTSLVFGRDPVTTISNYLAFAQVREDFKEEEQELVYPGQRAYVRVDAYAARAPYPARVKSIATVASQADFMSSDVKVYQTLVAIDGTVENLKPGMSAEVKILADESTGEVLTIPIQSVVGNISMAAKRKCFVLDGENVPQERDIVVGMSNDTLVEVQSGLNEGEKVVLNPAKLLPEKSGLKPGVPGGSRRGGDWDEGGGGKKGFKKGEGKGAGTPPGAAPGAFPGAITPDGKKWEGRPPQNGGDAVPSPATTIPKKRT